METHLVAGGAGFIAVNLIDRLLEAGHKVVAVDDLSRGRMEHLAQFQLNPNFKFNNLDCNDIELLKQVVKSVGPIQHVWHMAANSDIPGGIADPRIDLQKTFMTTFNLLLVMREMSISSLHFASSSAIYGDLGDLQIEETSGPTEPISNYGAMKLASEAQIRAAVEAWLPRADVFRFPNVVGVPATHGVILDFVRKLIADPKVLPVLGNGTQRKGYLHVEDLVKAMLFIVREATAKYNVFNIGPEDNGVTVKFIAETVRDRVAPGSNIEFGEGNRGWVGDVPSFRYSTKKLECLGWRPSMGSLDAIVRAVDQIALQESTP